MDWSNGQGHPHLKTTRSQSPGAKLALSTENISVRKLNIFRELFKVCIALLKSKY
jgi:hypothetical protein